MADREGALRVEVLGPLRAFRGDVELALGWPRQRAVLAALLLRAGQVVSRDELIDAVWGPEPPATAVNVVHAYVAGLRRALEPGRARRDPGRLLASAGPGYVLHLAGGQLDLTVAGQYLENARRARAAGDLDAAVAAMDAALGLWRGIALVGVPGPLAKIERDRLTELRLTVLEDRAGTLLSLGNAAGLAGELSALVTEHPFRERLAGLLMRALCQAGRQAEALAAYQATRRVLVAELGIEPGPDLRRLHDDILNNRGTTVPPQAGQPAGVRAAPAPPRQLPAVVRQFVGRKTELAALAALAREAATTSAVVISAIGGAAGTGKSALAVHFAHQVADKFPDGQLYVNLRGFAPSPRPAGPGEAIRGFLDAFAMEPSRIPVDLASQAGLYRSILAGKKVMLVLDNARDEDQVRPLFPGSGGSLVIVTSRRQLTGLAAADGASLLTLDVLTGDEARELLARRVGRERISAEPDAAGELTRLCARLPLALSIAAARAAARPNLPLASLAAGLRDECRRLDLLDGGETASSVRSAFSWSYRTLTLAAARMFRLLGVHPGPDITVPAAASLAAVTAGQAGAGLAELERAHLITEQAPGRFTFHDLLRAYAAGQSRAEDSETERRAAIHRTLDHYLHTASAGAMLLNPARDQVALTSPAEGVLPEDLAGIEQALAWFEAERDVLLAAIIKASRSGFAAHAWGTPAALTDFLERCGRWEDWTRTQRTALSAARQLGDLPAQALAHRNLGRALGRLGRYDSALAHLGHALSLHGQLGDAQSQARAYLSIDWILAEQRRYQEALGAARQALRLFQVSDDRAGQARALNNAGSDHASLGQYQQALECCQQALALHQGLGDRHGAAANWDSLGYVHHQLGHYQEAAACYRRALALCRDLDDHYSQAEVLSHLADTLHAIGTDGAAREAWQQALAILDGLHHPEAQQIRARLDRTECRGPSGDR